MKEFVPKITWEDPSNLIPYVNNTKKHAADQINKIASSISEFGFGQPVQVDKDKVIITGHGRTLAALKLKMEKIPCIVRSDLSKNAVKALRIADNKVAESEWDEDLLGIELNSLNEEGFLSFDALGFSKDELSSLMLGDVEQEAPQPTETGQDETHKLEAIYQVIVTAKDEEEQLGIIETLTEMGMECRALIS